MIVAIHQPNFAPWLGYFAKIAKADVFVFLDHVGYSKNGWTNRVRIKTSSGPTWLTVPALTSGKLGQPISEVQTNDNINWRKKLVGTLAANYARSSFYAPVTELVTCTLDSCEGHTLAAVNVALIREIASRIGLEAEFVLSSALDVSGNKTDLLVSIVQAVGADTYLCGDGADYQIDATFSDVGITIGQNHYQHPEYPQSWGDFVPGLSILDTLYNVGFDETASLLINREALVSF